MERRHEKVLSESKQELLGRFEKEYERLATITAEAVAARRRAETSLCAAELQLKERITRISGLEARCKDYAGRLLKRRLEMTQDACVGTEENTVVVCAESSPVGTHASFKGQVGPAESGITATVAEAFVVNPLIPADLVDEDSESSVESEKTLASDAVDDVAYLALHLYSDRYNLQ